MSQPPTKSVLLTTALAIATPAVADEPPKLAVTPAARLGTAPPGVGLHAGDVAPALTLDGLSGAPQSLGALYAKGPTYVVFYRGGWCPFCNQQLHELARVAPEFARRGVQLVAISVDTPSAEARTQAQHGIPFPMLSDPQLKAHAAFHVVHVAPEAEREALAGFGIDLASFSGESHHSFAVPAIFLVDAHGIIRFVHVDEDFKTRPSAQQLLDVAARRLGPGR